MVGGDSATRGILLTTWGLAPLHPPMFTQVVDDEQVPLLVSWLNGWRSFLVRLSLVINQLTTRYQWLLGTNTQLKSLDLWATDMLQRNRPSFDTTAGKNHNGLD